MNLWMKLLGHASPKRTAMWSNSRGVEKLSTGKLRRVRRQGKSKLVRQYENKEGQKRFSGIKTALKNSAILGGINLDGSSSFTFFFLFCLLVFCFAVFF